MAELRLEDRELINKARVLGGEVGLLLDDAELKHLVEVILTDLDQRQLRDELGLQASAEYFTRPISSFENETSESGDFEHLYLVCANKVPDFRTYFKCLCEIHKRRRKYSLILERQPFPTAQQIAPRSMLEFGQLGDKELASWMSWRKWLFDLDNRSGQETGYMFEPILAASLGGISYSAKVSPVRRAKDPSKGRQVDCVVGQDAYEFKIRVTIAASGQGRFAEELAFPEDCQASNFRPILVVLDPTPNPRLDQLVEAFSKSGGESHVGAAAWSHLETRSGSTMATFLERYVRHPLERMGPLIPKPLDMTLRQKAGGAVDVSFSNGITREITRREDPLLSGDGPEEEE